MLSDWTDEDPRTVYAKLKKQSGYDNFSTVPEMRPRPLLMMADVGTAHGPMSGRVRRISREALAKNLRRQPSWLVFGFGF